VVDVHNEARHLANLKSGKQDIHSVGGGKTKCNCGADSGKCPCAPGQCTCSSCAKNADAKTTAARTEELRDKLGADKIKVATSIAEAVSEADLIFICVSNDKAIKNTIESALQSDVEGKLFVDCSTVSPETTDSIALAVVGRGAEFVACPVFGAPAMADSGQLICVLAGAAASVTKVKPYTTGVMGRAIIDFSGEKHGKATLLKIIGNTFVLNMVETLAQGHVVAEKTGLGVEQLHQFVEVMFPGPFAAYSSRMRQGDYYKRNEPLFAADLAIKDVTHALSLAEKSGSSLPNMEVAKKHLEEVKSQQGAKGDIAGIYGAVRRASGLPFENK